MIETIVASAAFNTMPLIYPVSLLVTTSVPIVTADVGKTQVETRTHVRHNSRSSTNSKKTQKVNNRSPKPQKNMMSQAFFSCGPSSPTQQQSISPTALFDRFFCCSYSDQQVYDEATDFEFEVRTPPPSHVVKEKRQVSSPPQKKSKKQLRHIASIFSSLEDDDDERDPFDIFSRSTGDRTLTGHDSCSLDEDGFPSLPHEVPQQQQPAVHHPNLPHPFGTGQDHFILLDASAAGISPRSALSTPSTEGGSPLAETPYLLYPENALLSIHSCRTETTVSCSSCSSLADDDHDDIFNHQDGDDSFFQIGHVGAAATESNVQASVPAIETCPTFDTDDSQWSTWSHQDNEVTTDDEENLFPAEALTEDTISLTTKHKQGKTVSPPREARDDRGEPRSPFTCKLQQPSRSNSIKSITKLPRTELPFAQQLALLSATEGYSC